MKTKEEILEYKRQWYHKHKQELAQYKKKQYLKSKMNKSVEKICNYCNNPFFSLGNTNYCSIRCSSLQQWKNVEAKKKRTNKTRNDWKERWSYFWSKYYTLSSKKREEYFEEMKKTIENVYISPKSYQTSKIDDRNGVSSTLDKVAV